MDLWTIQMAQWRVARDLKIPLLDTTIKSGDRVFAPSWDIVEQVKEGTLSQLAYTELYTQLMRDSYRVNQLRWIEVCQMPVVAISCYCPDGDFCHRHVLAEMFKRVCQHQKITFTLKGELTKRHRPELGEG